VTPTRLQQKLIEQHGFLKRSVQSFMDGHSEEAVRIATAIRVLLHESRSSDPLLKQLNPSYLDMTILDTIPPGPSRPGGRILSYFAVGRTMISGKGAQPILDPRPPNLQQVKLGEWWQRCCLIFTDENGKQVDFTRKERRQRGRRACG
jgi:hypothetical protein